MTRDEIVKALDDGNYTIEHQEDCNCSFDWDFDGDTINDNCNGNECWEGMVLMIDGKPIIRRANHE